MAEQKAKQPKAANAPEIPHAEGKPPRVGAEGGVIQEGTDDFAPGAPAAGGDGPGVDTVKLQSADGKVVEVPVGVDGVNAVSANNPPRKAVLGGGFPLVGGEDNPTEARATDEGAQGDRVDKATAK